MHTHHAGPSPLTRIPSIVFVHGFTGHPRKTWTHQKGDGSVTDANDETTAEPPRKVPRRELFPSFRQSRRDVVASTSDPNPCPVYWPQDLLPTSIPSGRVLTYGYDTHLRHALGPPLNKATVYDIAWDFLVALEAERRTDPKRPIVFIAHSLGGIVVKEMLRRAGGCQPHHPHLHTIFESTLGIVFFGTPHGGSDPRGVPQRVLQKLVEAVGICVNEQIVNTLLPSSERLKELRDELGPIAQRQRWMIHSFQEGLDLKALGGRKVGS